MIKLLPYWVVPDSLPAFYETEGATAIQMVAKLYGKVNEMIEDYNHFVDEINAAILEFENSTNKKIEDFKECITKIMNDYIETIDTKINLQDDKIQNAINDQNETIANAIEDQNAVIADAVQYMKDNLVATVTNLFNQALENGEIYVSLATDYDEETKALTLGISAIASEELNQRLSELTTPEVEGGE